MSHSLSSIQLQALFVALPAIMLLVLALALRVFPGLWAVTVGGADHRRIHTMDGARGLLSLWVVSHHLLMSSTVDAQGTWQPPAGAFGVLLRSGVFIAPFFMLTAMLFGGRLLMNGGRIETVPFYVKRALRLAPAYFLAVALLILIAFILSKFQLRVPITKLMVQIIRWSLFDFVGRYDINGADVSGAYGVLWTLRYEILFYAALPVFAVLQRRLRSPLILVFGLLGIGVFMWPFIYFAGGVIAAICAVRATGPRAARFWQAASVGGVAAIIVAAGAGASEIQMHLIQVSGLIPILVCIARSLPLARPLAWRPLRFVGEASYSNYILHVPIIVLLSLLTRYSYVDAVQFPLIERTLFLSGIGCITLVGAILCLVWVEQPCARLGIAFTRYWRERDADRRADDRPDVAAAVSP